MRAMKLDWRHLAAAAVAAALAGCGGDNETTVPTPPPPTAAQEAPFSVFVDTVFATPANGTPVNVTNDIFNYDVNDDPTAFSALLAEGTY